MSENKRKAFYIDLKEVTNKEEFHEAFARQLPLPEYYGKNLDALYDVLTEYGEDWTIIIYNIKGFEETEPQYAASFIKMLSRAAKECPFLKIKIFP